MDGWVSILRPCNMYVAIDKMWDSLLCMHVFDQAPERMAEESPSVWTTIRTPPTRICDRLYLGSSWNACSKAVVERHGIHAILNVSEEIGTYQSTVSMHLPLRDNDSVDIRPVIETAVGFIDRYRDKGILVHCFAGCSRSVAIVVSWLMLRKGMEFQEAYDYVQARRHVNMSKALESQVRGVVSLFADVD